MAITAADNSANRSTVFEYLFRVLLNCDRVFFATNEGYDGALVSLAPVHTHRIFPAAPSRFAVHFNQLAIV
jgi:hypothetical protein